MTIKTLGVPEVARATSFARKLLDQCRNGYGEPLRPDYREWLEAVLMAPSDSTWEKAHRVMVTPRQTLWQAWIAVDPSAPRRGPTRIGAAGKLLESWPRVPDTFTLLRAIRSALATDRDVRAAERGGFVAYDLD